MEHPISILIVDDQLSAREYLSEMLAEEGYELAHSSDGEEALAKAAELIPDLILLDVMMPGMDGYQVCQRLRADPELAEVPVIMVTSLDDLDSRLRGLEVGVDDFITKPFNRAELQARVRSITRLNYQRRLHLLELKAQGDRTLAILQAVGEAVVVAEADGLIQYLNPAAVALTGFTPEEALGQSWRLWQNEETDDLLYDDILQMVGAGQRWRGEVVNRRKDGTLYDAALTVAPLFAPDDYDQPIGFVSVQRDITPLKRADRAKNEFVSNVSHELRTPLSVLTLVSDNLDTLYEGLSDDRRRKMIRDIQKHTQVLNELIGDVLEISRIDSRRVSMERERANLAQLARDEADKLLLLAQQKSQTLRVIGLDEVVVWGNNSQLRQVLRNLFSNALKYTPGEGQIVCECSVLSPMSPTQAKALEGDWPGVAGLYPDDWAALRVVDKGIGISQEHLSHLFERFYRVRAEQQVRGTGLGLAIARELIELHGGQIAVASVPDEGSIFAIYLPLSANGAAEQGVRQ